ncbi:MAG TPA: hypothetical protein VHR66_28730 [Gemmataceae bacterium]|nr:hypothetical protein [Gemmataceae bacterium]
MLASNADTLAEVHACAANKNPVGILNLIAGGGVYVSDNEIIDVRVLAPNGTPKSLLRVGLVDAEHKEREAVVYPEQLSAAEQSS